MSLAKTTRKAVLGLLGVAAISYGLRLYAQQQNGQLTPPPKAPSSQASTNSENSNSGSPLVVGERLIYNVSWSGFPSAARVEMEIAAQGQFYGRESYRLRSRVETLGQVRSLFGDIDNQYTSYVGLNDALPHRIVSATHQWQGQGQAQGQGRKQSEEVIVFDHSRQKAIFSDNSEVSIRGETYDLTSLIYWLRLQPLTDGSKYKFTALYNKELIEVEAVVKGRERVVAQAGAYNAVLVNFYPKGKYSAYHGYIYISADSQRLPVVVKANLPVGEARAELASVTFASSSEPAGEPVGAKLDLQPDEGVRPLQTMPITGRNPAGGSGNEVVGGNGPSPNGGLKPGIDAESAPKPIEYPFVVGERLSYDISWGSFSSIGKASFEARQQGMFNGNRVIEFFGEAVTIGAARTLIDVDDQVSSLVLIDSLVPIKTDLRLREGKRVKRTSATYDRSKNLMSLAPGSRTNIPPGAYDILSLFYAIRATDLNIGMTRDFDFLDANNRPQQLTIKVIKQESIGGPLGPHDTLRVDILAPEPAKKTPAQTPPAKIILAQTWISNDARRLPLYLVTRTRFGELRFQLVNAVNTK
ncbi:MAG TPA: DUF3108 domain-containing protein [Blastocatellia bacterium]|jgi:hypothetical protein|nr:DUF3108 domain-containing protein [Blastocatellia bacterium]